MSASTLEKASSRSASVACSGSISFSTRRARVRWSGTPPRMMSVPRPAMLVAMVTAPKRPARATISASRSWYLALRTTWRMPARLRWVASSSDFSMEIVPTSTGRPVSWRSSISRTAASNFSRSVRYTTSGFSTRMRGRLVGMTRTSSL